MRCKVENRLTIFTLVGVCSAFLIGISLKNFTKQPWTDRELMYFQFPGELFLRTMNCLILPLIVSSIVSASCHVSKSGSIGLKALGYYVTTTTLGISLCVILVETIRPGEFYKNDKIGDGNYSRKFVTTDTFLDLIRNLTPENLVQACLYQYQTVLFKPDNATVLTALDITTWEKGHRYIKGTNIMGVVPFSLVLGIAISKMQERGKPLLDFFQSTSDLNMDILNSLIMVVPIVVLFLIPGKILQSEDIGIMMSRLSIYVATVFLGLLIHGLIVLPLFYFSFTRKNPFKIFAKIGPAIVTAIGTSSSTATVPVTLKCLNELKVNPKVSRFIVPIGATINMDGIALYETIGALFIIQLRGMEFSLVGTIAMAITCTVSCIGAAGLPNGGYVMLIIVLESIDIPAEDVTLIITIDCFVDRIRTALNIIADTLGACLICHFTKSEEIEELGEVEELMPTEITKL